MRAGLAVIGATLAAMTVPGGAPAQDAAPATRHECPGPFGELVASEQVARDIALALIRGHENRAMIARYRLDIMPHPSRRDSWLAMQTLRGADANMRGGGGLAMAIDRCSGAISGFYYMR